MSPLLEAAKTETAAVHAFSARVPLADGQETLVHVVRYDRDAFEPRLVVLPEEQTLISWCNQKGIGEAMVGGFFLRADKKLLGETWLRGERQPSVPFTAPYDQLRASLHINSLGDLAIGHRSDFAAQPDGDLLQAGPLLVKNGRSALHNGYESEGFSVAYTQFDSDITDGRYPRAAIGVDDTYIWSVTCDGSSDDRLGLSISELSQVMLTLEVTEAMNLDGGGSATQISNGQLRNRPIGDGKPLPEGRQILSAIVFEPK